MINKEPEFKTEVEQMEGKCRFSIAEIQSLFQNISVNFKNYYMSKLHYGLTDQIEKNREMTIV